MLYNIWILLSSKINLRKIFVEAGTVENAAKNSAFLKRTELDNGYILENGIVKREGEQGHKIDDVIVDLIKTMQDPENRYHIMACLINSGFKIIIGEDGFYYYSKFYSPRSIKLRSDITFEKAKQEIKSSYKKRKPLMPKGDFANKLCEKVALDDEAYQYIVENELYYLQERIKKLLGNRINSIEIIEDLYTSLPKINEIRKKR